MAINGTSNTPTPKPNSNPRVTNTATPTGTLSYEDLCRPAMDLFEEAITRTPDTYEYLAYTTPTSPTESKPVTNTNDPNTDWVDWALDHASNIKGPVGTASGAVIVVKSAVENGVCSHETGRTVCGVIGGVVGGALGGYLGGFAGAAAGGEAGSSLGKDIYDGMKIAIDNGIAPPPTGSFIRPY